MVNAGNSFSCFHILLFSTKISVWQQLFADLLPGLKVTVADSLGDAIHQIQTHGPFDVVVSDSIGEDAKTALGKYDPVREAIARLQGKSAMLHCGDFVGDDDFSFHCIDYHLPDSPTVPMVVSDPSDTIEDLVRRLGSVFAATIIEYHLQGLPDDPSIDKRATAELAIELYWGYLEDGEDGKEHPVKQHARELFNVEQITNGVLATSK